KYLGAGIGDTSMHSAGINDEGNAYTGVGFEVAGIWDQIDDSASSAVRDLDYNNPKTAHQYGAGFDSSAYLPEATAAQPQYSSQSDGWWDCGFDTQPTPASAPN